MTMAACFHCNGTGWCIDPRWPGPCIAGCQPKGEPSGLHQPVTVRVTGAGATQRTAHREAMLRYWRRRGLLPSPQGAAQGGDAPAAAGGGDQGQGPQGSHEAPLAMVFPAECTMPQPRRRDGQPPCGECHLQDGEVCDICGAVRQAGDQGNER